jgi:hypothetical protein
MLMFYPGCSKAPRDKILIPMAGVLARERGHNPERTWFVGSINPDGDVLECLGELSVGLMEIVTKMHLESRHCIILGECLLK